MPIRAFSDQSAPSRCRPRLPIGLFSKWRLIGGTDQHRGNTIRTGSGLCSRILVAAFLGFICSGAWSLDTVVVPEDVLLIDLSTTTDRYEGIGPKLTLEDEGGGSPVIEVEAGAGNTDPAVNPVWAEYRITARNGRRRPAALKTGTSNDAKDLNAYGFIAPPSRQGRRRGGLS